MIFENECRTYEIFLLLIVHPCLESYIMHSAVIAGKESEEEGADEEEDEESTRRW